MHPRLVLVEGSIGTGKTTTARRLAEALSARGVRARWVAEGDVDHPADLEQVALVAPDELARLLAATPGWAPRVSAVARPDVAGLLVPYGLLERDHGPLPEPLRTRLQERDAYELPLAVHARLRLEQWSGFVRDVVGGEDDVVVLECCVVQNPLTVTLLRDDAPEDALRALVEDLVTRAAPLRPVLVHLRRADVAATFRDAVAERPPWWRDHVVEYCTRRGLGRRLGVDGLDGAVEVLRLRAQAEERLLRALEQRAPGREPVRVLRVELHGTPEGLPEPLRVLVDELVAAGGPAGTARGADR